MAQFVPKARNATLRTPRASGSMEIWETGFDIVGAFFRR
jgi:hypothetical protein